MKKAAKKQLWDIYLDKQLTLLTLEMEFDFEAISKTMNNITDSTSYTELLCRERYAYLHNLLKSPSSNIDEKIDPLGALLSTLPEERTPKNPLDLTEEDWEKAEIIDFLTGKKFKPIRENIETHKFYSEDYLREKEEKEAQFLAKFTLSQDFKEITSLEKEDSERNSEDFKLFFIRNGNIESSPFFSAEAQEIDHQRRELATKSSEFVPKIEHFKDSMIKAKRGFSRGALYGQNQNQEEEQVQEKEIEEENLMDELD